MRRSTVMIELAGDTALSRDLAAGGVFVPGCTLRIAEECELVVCGGNRRVSLPARVVYVDEHRGAGLELIGFSTAMRERIAELAPTPAGPTGDEPDPAPPAEDDLAVPVAYEDDDHRTVPVSTRSGVAQRAAFEVEAEDSTAPPATVEGASIDDLAVPIACEDDDHRTVPVFAISDVTGDATGGDPAPRRTHRDLLESDPALATSEADAAFFNVMDPGPAEPAGAEPAGAEADAAFFDVMYPGPAEPADAEPPGAEPAGETADDDGTADDDDITDDDGAPLAAEPGATDDPPFDVGGPAGEPELEVGEAGDRGGEPRIPRNVHERLRGLNLAAQIKLATSGEQHERIVLERLYGKNVWETLLRNPRLTAPEVSRIARYGALPRVLLEIILANNAWLGVPEVRRAVLSNPRLGADQIMKVLRLVPKHELRLAAIQTAYPHPVRNAAKMLLRGE